MKIFSPSVTTFRALHESGCFVIPNPWNIGTALCLQNLGFKALATTSAGVAFDRGLPDEVWAIPRDAMLAHIREIVTATPLPVNADFQSGYAHDAEGVAANVALCVATGVAGLSIEDATGDNAAPLYDKAMAVRRIQMASEAICKSDTGVVLTARCEARLVDASAPLNAIIERLVAYAEAGADCLYAPGIRDTDEVAAIVKAVAPKPVNVLVSQSIPSITVSRLAELGVRRISVGSALARTAWRSFLDAAKAIAETGTFDSFAKAASFQELNRIFHK